MMRRRPRAHIPADEDGKYDEEEAQGPKYLQMRNANMMRKRPRAQIPADEDGEYDEEEAQGPADDPGDHAKVLLQIQYQDPLIALRGGGDLGVGIFVHLFHNL